MTTHHFAPNTFFNTLGAHAPVLSVESGDTVITETLDAHGFDRDGVQRGRDPNPMTGPFFVKGAEPGDALAVKIVRIEMNRATGWTRQGLAWNVVEPAQIPLMPAREKIVWDIERNSGRISLQEPLAALRNWSIPIEPMIGCFGVAPGDGEAISTATSGRFGGNMDYRGFKPGCEVQFPVSVPGALFFLGDVHGCQGDGEIAGTGIETSAEVEFSVRMIKGANIGWPRGETETDIFCAGNARPLEQALQHATAEMLVWLEQRYGLDRIAASHLLGMAVRYDIANVFNPAFSVVCRIEKPWLPNSN
ncbi:MAG: acetamidase [Rhizobiales bacterium]|nr:acetamidase [Hyphomicrobiales bacterium]